MKPKPILVDGELVWITQTSVPRLVQYEDGTFLLRKGETVVFGDLRSIGQAHTDAYGMLNSYSTSREDSDA